MTPAEGLPAQFVDDIKQRRKLRPQVSKFRSLKIAEQIILY